MKTNNPWLKHMAKVRAEHPKIKDVSKLSKIGKKTYNPIKK